MMVVHLYALQLEAQYGPLPAGKVEARMRLASMIFPVRACYRHLADKSLF
jgi:hypothetical protein